MGLAPKLNLLSMRLSHKHPSLQASASPSAVVRGALISEGSLRARHWFATIPTWPVALDLLSEFELVTCYKNRAIFSHIYPPAPQMDGKWVSKFKSLQEHCLGKTSSTNSTGGRDSFSRKATQGKAGHG